MQSCNNGDIVDCPNQHLFFWLCILLFLAIGDRDIDDNGQVGTSVAWAQGHEGNSSYSDYALFGAPGCFTWRGNLYGRQTGHFLGKLTSLHHTGSGGDNIHLYPLAGSIRESQTALGDSNFLR